MEEEKTGLAKKKSNDKGKSEKNKKSVTTKKSLLKTFCLIILLLIFVGATTIVSQLLVGYAMMFILGPTNFARTIPMAIYSALSYILATVFVVVVPRKIYRRWVLKDTSARGKGELKKEIGLTGLPTWTDLGLAPIAFIVSLLLAAGLVWLFSLFPWFNAEEVQSVGFNTYTAGLDRIIAFIVLVVVAPIFEEIIFRGWLYGRIRKMLSGKMAEIAGIILANFLVSLLFGIVHLQWNVGVNVFALSVVLCALREITGTIHAGIITHMIKNGVAFYLLYVLGM